LHIVLSGNHRIRNLQAITRYYNLFLTLVRKL